MIWRAMASGSSDRGLSEVTMRKSEYSSAACAILGRLGLVPVPAAAEHCDDAPFLQFLKAF